MDSLFDRSFVPLKKNYKEQFMKRDHKDSIAAKVGKNIDQISPYEVTIKQQRRANAEWLAQKQG